MSAERAIMPGRILLAEQEIIVGITVSRLRLVGLGHGYPVPACGRVVAGYGNIVAACGAGPLLHPSVAWPVGVPHQRGAVSPAADELRSDPLFKLELR